ncbi:MAG: hypothetical protein AAF556_02790 [Pseudomonadota bacterium]
MSKEDNFRALVMRGRPVVPTAQGEEETARLTDDMAVEEFDQIALPDADITLAVSHARLGFRDALTLTGRDRWVSRYPHIPGNEFVGKVVESNDPRFAVGHKVFASGHGLGERHWGGLSQRARLIGDWLMLVPDGLSPDRMVEAGLPFVTAQLALDRLLEGGLQPDAGPVLVTEAMSEVGKAAVELLLHHGFQVAVTMQTEALNGPLADLDLAEAVSHSELLGRSGPVLGPENWAGMIDTAGGSVLSAALAELRMGASAIVTAPTLGHDLPGDLSPFVVRGCRLIGVNAQNLSGAARHGVWERLTPVLREPQSDAIEALRASRYVGLNDVPEIAAQLLQGDLAGQVIVDLAA